MKRILWILAAILASLVLLLAAVLWGLQRWVGGDDFRARVQAQAQAALGVPVTLGAVQVDAWPLPAVALGGIVLATQPPLTVERVQARPVWAALLRGRLELATLVVRKAVLPAPAVAVLAAGLQRGKPKDASVPAGGAVPGSGSAATPAVANGIGWLPRRVLLDGLTWVDAKGLRSTVDAQAQLGDDGWPDSAQVKVLEGRLAGAQVRLQREGGQWLLDAQVGGGTVKGPLRLKPGSAGAAWLLQGELETVGVQVAALTAPARALTGLLAARTTLRAEFREPGGLADALQSQTRFTVRDAVVHGIDLARAVKSVGLSRGGETRLDTLAGQVLTQGRAVQLNNLVASSGVLAASGNVALAPDRSLSGRVTVELAAGSLGSVTQGAVGVPLAVGGTLDAPTVTLTRAALLGAAIGTVVMPGVGTGAGAQLGDRLGQGLRGLLGK